MIHRSVRWGGVLALVAVAAIVLALWPWSVEPEPRMVSTVDPQKFDAAPALTEVVGLCALHRETGALEGRIVDVVESGTVDEPRFAVRVLDGSEREYHVRVGSVHLELCERALAATPGTEPIRRGGGR